jgi:hypothetical protein
MFEKLAFGIQKNGRPVPRPVFGHRHDEARRLTAPRRAEDREMGERLFKRQCQVISVRQPSQAERAGRQRQPVIAGQPQTFQSRHVRPSGGTMRQSLRDAIVRNHERRGFGQPYEYGEGHAEHHIKVYLDTHTQ